jgi:hypothetical protein
MSDDPTRSLLAHILIVLPNVDRLLQQTERLLDAPHDGVSKELSDALVDMQITYTTLRTALTAARGDVDACVGTDTTQLPYTNGCAL